MMQAFDYEALYAKSKVYVERSFKAEHDKDQAGFQLWASLSLELLGKATLARIHPALVADPDDPGSWVQAEKEPLTFRAVGQSQPMTLVPMARILHEQYTVYWKVTPKKA